MSPMSICFDCNRQIERRRFDPILDDYTIIVPPLCSECEDKRTKSRLSKDREVDRAIQEKKGRERCGECWGGGEVPTTYWALSYRDYIHMKKCRSCGGKGWQKFR